MAPEPDDIDDVALMLRYRAGELDAFDALYARHKGPLYRYCVRQCRNPDIAADIFQDVWSRIVRSRHDYRPTAKFATYLYSIAHNCLVDHFRRQDKQAGAVLLTDGDVDPPDEGPGPEAVASLDETAALVRHALSQLPAAQREAFLLHEEAGLSLAEIAVVTEANAETVKSRLRYAVRKLRELLSGEGGAT